MKRARVQYQGVTYNAVEANGQLKLSDGRIVSENQVVWLPPVVPRTVFALGLNFTGLVKEWGLSTPKEPLAFQKGPGTFIGHRGQTRRPPGVSEMHYECELTVVIGKTTRSVKAENAYDYIAGYTVANDYNIRDYMEGYYRPNVWVKNRDTGTPIGPWLVDTSDVNDPMNLAMRSYINGKLVQDGSTKDMIFPIPQLIEYFSSFMTLDAGDMILTGTPEGLVDTKVGDEVVTEIEGIGRLVNTVVGE